ncbi:hypothetical protein L210DRAFT_859486, partial [Boletus edulis BED1]
GRNRDSMHDIEQDLIRIFSSHPMSRLNQAQESTIPADALPDVFREFSDLYNDVDLLTDSEMEMLRVLLASNPGIEVTPQVLLQFIAERTKNSPRESPGKSQSLEQSSPRYSRESPDDSPQEGSDGGESDDVTFTNHRGRRPFARGKTKSRSSSQNSVGTSRIPSRPPSVPPKTPLQSGPPSAFDSSKRQRTTPLSSTAPSSWAKRPAPASRRRSVDGSSSRDSSDNESSVTSPSAWGRSPGRTRAPSNPTTPSSAATSPNSVSFASPPFARPHSRAASQPLNSIGFHYATPDRGRDASMSPGSMSPDTSIDQSFDYPRGGTDAFMDSISSLPMPRRPDSETDSDSEDESSLGLVLDRSATSSMISLEPLDRVDALQKANAELSRKLIEADRALQNKLTEHDDDLEEMQARLEELKSELTATKREEKELRAKERVTSTQMTALESEIAKLQKSLENARISYQSLQKQYQEQCAESERYRNTLRRRDQELKDLQDISALQALEVQKYLREHDSYEERLAQLEAELAHAQQAYAQLDEQKQENLMLKETIDRMRFEMDEMRNLNAMGAGSGSGTGSASGSVGKSLGAELMGKMGGQWGMDGEEEDEEEGLDLDGEDGQDTEGEEEDVIQTIITRKKRVRCEALTFEETKEYADASTQYYASEHTSVCAMQTEPEPQIPAATFGVQTETPSTSLAIQTEPEPLPIPRITASIEVQTEAPEPERTPEADIESELSRSPSPIEEESLASSSSTVLPPTPKGGHTHSDLPPSYSQIVSSDPFETLQKWHHGLQLPISGLPSGISDDAAEEWRSLKAELGVECAVIDQIVDASTKTGTRPNSHKNNKFYNIYNTYVYGGDKDGSGGSAGGGSFGLNIAKQLLFCMGASACMYLAMGPYIAAQYTPVGGATYYDRAAWSSFNTMQAPGEGFGYDGTSALWNIVGRVGYGAARIAGGWPT